MSKDSLVRPEDRLLSDFPPASYDEWRKLAEEQLKGAPFEKKLVTPTVEGIDLQPLYHQGDVAGLPHLRTWPGLPPYLRGGPAAGHAGQPWLICQEIAYGTAEAFNQAIKYDLERGQTAVTLRLDKATRLGQDPDEAQPGHVGQGGLSIATVDDLARALEGIDLEQTPLYIQASAAAVPTTALLMALVKRQGKALARLRGGIEMDPLGNMAREGVLPRSVAGAYDQMAHLLKWAKANAPQWQTVTVHGQPYSDGGGSAVQELAFVLATAVEYLRALQARGLSIDEITPRFRFAFSLGSHYFMEIAKLRAARLLWAKVVQAFGGSPAAQQITLHGCTATWNKTAHDPYVNMLRVTIEAFAGAAGGCDSIHTGQFDEAIRPPDEFSRRIARNTQIILQNEAHLPRVIDPAGGSWYVEKLTDQVARAAWQLFQEVEWQGGMAQALQAGFPQAQVAQTAAKRAGNLATRKETLLGTNRYANLQEKLPEPDGIGIATLHKKRADYVAQFRTGLDTDQSTVVMQKLAEVLEAEHDAILEAAIGAALAGATIGEIARTLRKGDETKATIEAIPARRGGEPFEALRAAAEAYRTRTGARPRVFLANLGPISQHKARADFAADFFQIGGFEALNNNGFPTPEQAAQAALDSGAPVVVICSTDETYPEVVPPLVKAIKAAKPATIVVLAGYPADQIEAHRAAGVDEFIHLRANVVEVLEKVQKRLEIRD